MITFDEARATVAATTGLATAEYGWENDDVFVVAIDWGAELPGFDEPDHLVDKTTGAYRKVVGALGMDPAPNLTPIGAPPE